MLGIFTLFDIWPLSILSDASWRLNALPKDIHGAFPGAADLTSKWLKFWILIVTFTFMDKLHRWTWIYAFFLRLLLSQTNFFDYIIMNMNRGHSFSLLEAKNRIRSNGGAQSVSQSVISALKQEQSLIAWPLSEALAISLPLALREASSLRASFRPGAWDEEPAFREISKGLVQCLVSR